jgi:hypothetical protein
MATALRNTSSEKRYKSASAINSEVGADAVTGAISYRIDVSASPSFNSILSGYRDLDVGNNTSASVPSLALNTTYYYRVRANNGASVSADSNVITVTTAATTTKRGRGQITSQ